YNQIHISKYNSEGQPLWTLGSTWGTCNGIAVDPSGQAFITGELIASAFWDNTFVTNRGAVDLFVAKVFDEIPPVLLGQLAPRFVRSGDTITFNMSSRSIVPVTYQWLFNGQPITNATNSSLVLSNLAIGRSGS